MLLFRSVFSLSSRLTPFRTRRIFTIQHQKKYLSPKKKKLSFSIGNKLMLLRSNLEKQKTLHPIHFMMVLPSQQVHLIMAILLQGQ